MGVPDNDGNIPLHAAAGSLTGDTGAEVIWTLLDEAERQAPSLRLPVEARLGLSQPGGGASVGDKGGGLDDDMSGVTAPTTACSSAAAAAAGGETSFCNLVKNGDGHTPLVRAIRSTAGWQIVESLVCGSGGKVIDSWSSSLERDTGHLLR